jgi:hypothetical protein
VDVEAFVVGEVAGEGAHAIGAGIIESGSGAHAGGDGGGEEELAGN